MKYRNIIQKLAEMLQIMVLVSMGASIAIAAESGINARANEDYADYQAQTLFSQGKLASSAGLPLLKIEQTPLVPFEAESRRIAECGPETYNSGVGEVCGISAFRYLSSAACNPIYPVGSGSVCGIKYGEDKNLIERLTRSITRSPTTGHTMDIVNNECRSKSGEVLYTTTLDSPCARYCQSIGHLGASQHDYNVVSDGSKDFLGNQFWNKEWSSFGACTVYSTCRSSNFGGPVGYESCRDPSHGVEAYKTCEHESFGVATYRSCSVIKDRFELSVYLATLRAVYPEKAALLALSEVRLARELGQKQDMSCLIQKYSDNTMYEEIIYDLRDLFTKSFGEFDVPEEADCENYLLSNQDFLINGKYCSEFELSEVLEIAKSSPNAAAVSCVDRKNINYLREWFRFHREQLSRLLDDVIARVYSSDYQSIQELDFELSAIEGP